MNCGAGSILLTLSRQKGVVSRRSMVTPIFSRQGNAMFRFAALFGIFIATLGAAVAQDAKDAKQDAVTVHGKSLALSCAEWKRNQDGSWTSTGPLLVGTDTVNNVILRGKDAQTLEGKCGGGSATTAKPTPKDDPTKHAGHRHHGAAAGEGT
jgi:hypothetical protein